MVTTVTLCNHKNSEDKEKVGNFATYGAPKRSMKANKLQVIRTTIVCKQKYDTTLIFKRKKYRI
jgi:hypothetical protein